MAPKTNRTLHQIVDTDGNACKAVLTENLWVGYGSPNQQFAYPTSDNEVTALTTGEEYFKELMKALEGASSEIYIAGWQVNWDAQLDAKGTRLFDVLLAAARKNPALNIYVMPWDDKPPLQTYDDQAVIVLEMINKDKVVGRKCVHVRLSTNLADKAESFYAHHQKFVVVDRNIAFVGGIDVCYGRYDDANYDLHADAKGRQALNRYNGCIAWTGVVDEKTVVVDPDYASGGYDSYVKNPFDKDSKTNAELIKEKVLAGAHQVPYDDQGPVTTITSFVSPRAETNEAKFVTLDAATQPRMPWQDSHCKIVGPAVLDVARNFVMRWNVALHEADLAKSPLRLPVPAVPARDLKPSKCKVQVLRSQPRNFRFAEHKRLLASDKKSNPAPSGAQDDICRAMCILIEKAKNYIYIENQFFVSAFGALDGYEKAGPNEDPSTGPAGVVMESGGFGRTLTRSMPGDARGMPENKLLKALVDRLKGVILSGKKDFHVYITLPVHSEGMLNVGNIMAQVHWTMQTLVHGTHSLLNSIRRFLAAKELHAKEPTKGIDAFLAAVALDSYTGYKDIDIKRCFDYVTLLNLRNWEKLGSGKDERYVTEQIYIHNKMMVVDDRYAIIGSANINDRSLLGGRDTELAVLVMDTEHSTCDLSGTGKTVPVRNFARDLRIKVWEKIFGITAGGSKSAKDELAQAVLQPAAPASWKAIQKRAQANTKLYDDAFDWIPRNKSKYRDDQGDIQEVNASIWPRWNVQLADEIDKITKSKKAQIKTLLQQKIPTSKALYERNSKVDTLKKEIDEVSMTLNGRYMPFNAEFWKTPQHSPAAAKLTGVKGFITLLPIHWTEGENNKIPYHIALVAQNEPTPALPGEIRAMAQRDNTNDEEAVG